MQIWPAIDIRAGRCVRLIQGDYEQETVYGNSPADMAIRWVADGATGLHLVDLDGAKTGKSENFEAIAKIAEQVKVPIQVGGGIRDAEIITRYLEIGIRRIVLGTKAFKDPDWASEISRKFPGTILIGLDSRDGKVATDGWMETSETADVDFALKMSQQPIAGIIYTDISKDGMLAGPNFDAMEKMNNQVNVPVIASGGVTTTSDISRLSSLGLAGCVVGRALYEGKLTLGQAIDAAENGVSAS